jgi:Tfp pilus assembly major pilin PilA
MDEERALNQRRKVNPKQQRTSSSSSSSQQNLTRSRTASSPAFIFNRNNEQSPHHLQTTRLPSNSFDSTNNMEQNL